MKHCSSVPAFVSKLWTLVEAQSTDELICWSPDGCRVLVQDEQRFSREVLPLYFKHSNMTSFVRQLNMYGFHKVVHVDAGLPKADGQVNRVEFQHEHFRRARPHLLGLIRRKVSVSRGVEEGGQISQVLVQVSHVRGWQDSSDLKLMALCRENESLWRELDSLRQNYQQHHKIIRKIIKLIINSVQSNGIKGCKRRLPMIDNSGEFQSAPKYARSLSTSSLQEIPSLQELDVSPDVYSSGMIISDITHLLDQTPEPSTEPLTESLPVNLPSVELALSLLDDPAVPESEEIPSERMDVSDPLALIDSSLAEIRSCSSPSPDLDDFSKILIPGCHISAVKDSVTETKMKPRSPNEADTPPHIDTVMQQRSLQQNGDSEQECCDGGECPDILQSLLQLAQEASSLSFSNATLPLELSFII